jgi:hypothetical protein
MRLLWVLLMVSVFVLSPLAVMSPYYISPPSSTASSSNESAPIVAALSTNVVLSNLGLSGYLPQSFWSIDAHTSAATGFTSDPSVGEFLNDSTLTTIRYGSQSEYCNATDNFEWSDSGTHSLGCSYNISAFKSWCYSLTPHCESVLSLPGEINSSSADAYIVKYIVNTLGFQPTYFTIGNEPSNWVHYNEPWSAWRSGDDSKPTAQEYAIDVRNAIAAIKAVDPSAHFDGGEFATAANGNFFAETIDYNAANIAFVAYHSYPSLTGSNSPTNAQYLGALDSTHNITSTVAEFRSGCVSNGGGSLCNTEPIQIGEYNGGPSTGGGAPQDAEFVGATFLAASAVQAMTANITALTDFDLQGSSFGYNLMDSSNSIDAQGQFYTEFAPYLQNDGAFKVGITGLGPNLNAWAVRSANATGQSLLVVNANTTQSISFLPSTVIAMNNLTKEVSWNSSQANPVVTTRSGESNSTIFTVPPEGMLLLRVKALPFPATPIDLTATAVSGSQIDLHWVNAAGTLTDNHVYWGTSCGSLTAINIGSVVTYYNKTGLSSDTTYCFTVTATNSTTGETPQSLSATATTFATVPAAPTNLDIVNITSSTMLLRWVNPSGPLSFVNVYQFSYQTTCTGQGIQVSSIVENGYEAQGLFASTKYAFIVNASSSGGTGPNSSCVTGTTLAAGSTVPFNVSASAYSVSAVQITWVNPTETVTDNHLYWGVSADCITGTPHLTAIDLGTVATVYDKTGLNESTSYCFAVTASTSGGEGPLSNTVNATTLGIPPPTNTTVINIQAWNATASWTNPVGITVIANTIYIAMGSVCTSFSVIINLPFPEVPNEVMSNIFMPHTQYCLVVTITNQTAQSGPSNAVVFTTANGPMNCAIQTCASNSTPPSSGGFVLTDLDLYVLMGLVALVVVVVVVYYVTRHPAMA